MGARAAGGKHRRARHKFRNRSDTNESETAETARDFCMSEVAARPCFL